MNYLNIYRVGGRFKRNGINSFEEIANICKIKLGEK